MGQFPDPVPLPSSVIDARNQRRSELKKALFLGLSMRIFIMGIELIAAWVFSSSALFMDGISLGVDGVTMLLMVITIQMAARPPDEDHPFGHGRYEPFSGLMLSLFLFGTGAIFSLYQCYQMLWEGKSDAPVSGAWLIPLLGLILFEATFRLMLRVARKHRSKALEVDAWHFRIDSLSSLFAFFALVGAALLPNWGNLFDLVGALLIGMMMMVFGIRGVLTNFFELTDHIPEEKLFKIVKEAARSVKGVEDIEKTRIQCYGPDAHVDVDVEVDPNMSVFEAHRISQKVRCEIQKQWPQVRDVTVHIEPYYPGDH